MKRQPLRARRFVRAAGLVGIVVAFTLAVAPAANESSTQNRLDADVVATNHGPLPACSDNCTLANIVRHYVYVENENELTNLGGTRAAVPNAFVVSSVDEAIFVDGVDTFDMTWTPPPNAVFRGASGNWPSTVTCPPTSDPCNVVGSPAVDPGENTAILHLGWVHGADEPNGTYEFRFTVHGTLNGTPIDLTASSPRILMTD